MDEEELKKIKENIKTYSVEIVIALYLIAYEEIKMRMKINK